MFDKCQKKNTKNNFLSNVPPKEQILYYIKNNLQQEQIFLMCTRKYSDLLLNMTRYQTQKTLGPLGPDPNPTIPEKDPKQRGKKNR